MLKLYALDPAAVAAGWQNCSQITSYFGFDRGRVVEAFPRTWWKQLLAEIDGRDDLREIERERIKTKVRRCLERSAVHSPRIYRDTETWLSNAEREHQRSPFEAVIASQRRDLPNWLLVPEDIDEDNASLAVTRTLRVARTAEALTRALSPLFRYGKDFIFVDPHFDPYAARFRNTLAAFLNEIKTQNRRPRRLEYHLIAKDGLDADWFRSACETNLQGVIPSPYSVTFFRWREKTEGEQFHARYVLTERGGVKIDPGLDQGKTGQSAPVELLEQQEHTLQLSQFDTQASVFELQDPPLLVAHNGYIEEQ